jgi:hypothetical protein
MNWCDFFTGLGSFIVAMFILDNVFLDGVITGKLAAITQYYNQDLVAEQQNRIQELEKKNQELESAINRACEKYDNLNAVDRVCPYELFVELKSVLTEDKE